MKVDRAVLREIRMKLRHPFEISSGVTEERRILLLTLHGEGLEGWGECVASESPAYAYETTDTAWHVLTDFVPDRLGPELRLRRGQSETGWLRAVTEPQLRGNL